MTREERNNKLKHFITCLKCEVSGKHCDGNCSTQYDAGNMGEIIENLEAISKVLEQEPTTKNDLGVDCTPNTISFKEMTDNLKITAEDIENAEDLEYSIEPLIRPKNNLGVDCISRVDVNQVIEDYMDEQYHVLSDRTRERAFGAKAVKARINELQPVTPIRPKGHWIEEKNDYGEIEHWHCSNCYDDSGFITTCKWDYCPECGSDNREVDYDKRRSDRKS